MLAIIVSNHRSPMAGRAGGNSRSRWHHHAFILFFLAAILFAFDGGLEEEGGWPSSIPLLATVEPLSHVDVSVVVVGMVPSVGEQDVSTRQCLMMNLSYRVGMWPMLDPVMGDETENVGLLHCEERAMMRPSYSYNTSRLPQKDGIYGYGFCCFLPLPVPTSR